MFNRFFITDAFSLTFKLFLVVPQQCSFLLIPADLAAMALA